MESFINALVSGLILGALYAIMALGLTIIYGVSRVFNFGHGIVAVIGAYITWLFLTRSGLGLMPSILASLPIMFLFGWLLYRLTIGSLLRKPHWEFSTVLFMLGLGILLENVTLQLFGPRVKFIPEFFQRGLKLGFVKSNWHEISLIAIVVVAIVILTIFFKRSRMGQAMRAVAQSIPGARLVGIDIDRIFGYTFGLAFIATGFSGILLGTKYYMTPHIGWDWMIKGFVIVTFGGLGSTAGAIYGAVILGIVEALATLYLGAIWVWPTWFVLFIVILLLRPRGILGGRM